MNTIFNDNVYFGHLQKFNYLLKTIAKAEAVIRHLSLRGVPEGSVIFSSPKKKYTKKSGEEKEYIYTNAYLYINGTKYYISKKFKYPEDINCRDLNDYTNPANHLFLLTRFWMRSMARRCIKVCTTYAKALAKLLNSIKSHEIQRIKFDTYRADAIETFISSEENFQLANQIDNFLDQPLIKQLSALDLRPTLDIEENKSFMQSKGAKEEQEFCNSKKLKKARKIWYKIRNKNKKSIENEFIDKDCFETDLRKTFSNYIINECGEQVRSKNEIIAIRCARDCGLCYELEPYYPDSSLRADMLIRSNGLKIFVEIAGYRDLESYEERLKEKISYAAEHNVPLVIIDMTAYPDKLGKSCMKLNYTTICRIFMYIQLGVIKEGIYLPY